MTKILFYKEKGLLTGLEISGHTGKESCGKDVLCAAISTASQMVVVGLTEELKLSPFVEISDAYLKIRLSKADAERQDVQLLMKTCLSSLRKIVRDEKKFVNLEVKNV